MYYTFIYQMKVSTLNLKKSPPPLLFFQKYILNQKNEKNIFCQNFERIFKNKNPFNRHCQKLLTPFPTKMTDIYWCLSCQNTFALSVFLFDFATVQLFVINPVHRFKYICIEFVLRFGMITGTGIMHWRNGARYKS